MRRWNGWGDESVQYPLPEKAGELLRALVGPGQPTADATLETVLAHVPPSRLAAHPLVQTDPLLRLRHARGQSLPDWIALRGGCVPAFPDGVAYPTSTADIQDLLRFAANSGITLIPYGGGTSVVGHINPLPGERPTLTVNLRRLNQLHELDDVAQLATFGAGVSGPELEAHLRAQGFTLGHFPQSFELSTLGGWIATRSSGQQSLGYGRIEALFAGGMLIGPGGILELHPFPASAAGPDLRELVLGSEGRLGFITEATMRIAPLPQEEAFHAVFFPDFEQGRRAARTLVQAHLPLSLLRLSTAIETETTLALAGHERLLSLLDRYLSLRGATEGKCLMLVGFSGSERIVNSTRKEALAICHDFDGVHAGPQFGQQWHKSRFHTPYLRNTLWQKGYAVDTLETAVPWSRVPQLLAAVETALREALAAQQEQAHVFSHLSHLYPSGASIYTTLIFRRGQSPEETLARWQRLKRAASETIVQHQGTISHQHGVGSDHAPYLAAEKGTMGLALIEDATQRLDPRRVMNPGKLLPEPVHGQAVAKERQHVDNGLA